MPDADDSEALREPECANRLIAEDARDMIWRTDTRGVCTYVSPACREVLGYEPEELVGTSLFDLAHPEAASHNRALFEREITFGVPVGQPLTTRMRHKHGSYVWIESTSKLLRDAEGRVVAVQASARDVNERVVANEALGRSEKNFRSLLDQMPNAVIVHRGARVVYANPSCGRLLGYDPGELVGRHAFDLVDPADREGILAQFRAMPRVHTTTPEHRLLASDGRRVVVKVNPLPIVFEGELADMAIVEDLSAQKALEAELLRADRMVALGRLAASVGHEINNPLSYVLGNLELVRAEAVAMGPAGALLVQRLAAIEEGIERVRAIAADLRDLASAHEGALGAVDPLLAIERAVATANHETKLRARVVRDLRSTRHVRADERRLLQVLVNLLVNAAQAIPAGRADDNEIRVITRDEADGTVCIEVNDTGIGIPDGDPARLFDPFFTTKGDQGGTGLGLSISHRIVTSFGGSIRAKRRPDRGSVFRVSLPAASEAAGAAPPRAPVDPAATRKLRLLLVDDERALTQVLRVLLAGHDVVIEHGRRAAIDRLTLDDRFDVVVCDLQMPDGSGADVYEHARLARPGLEQRFIFMTGGAATERAQAFLRDCVQPVIDKPFESDELHAAIARVVVPER